MNIEYEVEKNIEQENIVEAILFMMGDSMSVESIAVALHTDKDEAKLACERLVEKYENIYKDRGIKVIRINNKYQMVSNNKYFANLVAIAARPKKPVLTEAILETLSIIAYKQPITKPEIENIRGVKSDFACNKLLEYGLIEEQGRLDAPGRPIIFGTTEEFLLRFGIETIDDLPMIDADRMTEIETEVEKELSESLGEKIFVKKSNQNEDDKSNEINANADTNNNTEINVDINSESDVNSDVDTNIESNAISNSNVDTNVDANVNSDVDTNIESNSNSDVDTNVDDNSNSDVDINLYDENIDNNNIVDDNITNVNNEQNDTTDEKNNE